MKRDAEGRLVEFGEFPELETGRLRLRRIALDDAEFWLRNFSAPSMAELTAYESPKDLATAREEILQFAIHLFEENRGIRWGIALKSSPALIGTLGYHQWVKDGGHHARIGYDLLPEHRRKGFMTEAMTAVLSYGIETMGLNRIEALIDPRNEASIRLVESLGFHRDGVLREHAHFRGRFLDDVCYSLLAREWRASRRDTVRESL